MKYIINDDIDLCVFEFLSLSDLYLIYKYKKDYVTYITVELSDVELLELRLDHIIVERVHQRPLGSKCKDLLIAAASRGAHAVVIALLQRKCYAGIAAAVRSAIVGRHPKTIRLLIDMPNISNGLKYNALRGAILCNDYLLYTHILNKLVEFDIDYLSMFETACMSMQFDGQLPTGDSVQFVDHFLSVLSPKKVIDIVPRTKIDQLGAIYIFTLPNIRSHITKGVIHNLASGGYFKTIEILTDPHIPKDLRFSYRRSFVYDVALRSDQLDVCSNVLLDDGFHRIDIFRDFIKKRPSKLRALINAYEHHFYATDYDHCAIICTERAPFLTDALLYIFPRLSNLGRIQAVKRLLHAKATIDYTPFFNLITPDQDVTSLVIAATKNNVSAGISAIVRARHLYGLYDRPTIDALHNKTGLLLALIMRLRFAKM